MGVFTIIWIFLCGIGFWILRTMVAFLLGMLIAIFAILYLVGTGLVASTFYRYDENVVKRMWKNTVYMFRLSARCFLETVGVGR